MAPDNSPHLEELTWDAILSSVRRLGWGADFNLDPLRGGANNQVFHITAGSHQAVLKIYFRHSKDIRDRLAAEWAWTSFAWNNGIKTVARPLMKDSQNNLAFYDYIPGRPLDAAEIDAGEIGKVVDFFAEINRHRSSPDAASLPLASEAFFSVDQHVAGVNRRIDALGGLASEAESDRAARLFVANELLPAWKKVQHALVDFHSDAALGDRCLSPSDFGFHNALLRNNGDLFFFDFEYAGWDDPAKTICDFFCQPKIPIPLKFYDEFSGAIAACTSAPDKTLARAEKLLPLYRLKWCCILLNEFLPVDVERRRFSGVLTDGEEHRMQQLNKAKQMLAGIWDGGVQ
jgi:hypothetical protein